MKKIVKIYKFILGASLAILFATAAIALVIDYLDTKKANINAAQEFAKSLDTVDSSVAIKVTRVRNYSSDDLDAFAEISISNKSGLCTEAVEYVTLIRHKGKTLALGGSNNFYKYISHYKKGRRPVYRWNVSVSEAARSQVDVNESIRYIAETPNRCAAMTVFTKEKLASLGPDVKNQSTILYGEADDCKSSHPSNYWIVALRDFPDLEETKSCELVIGLRVYLVVDFEGNLHAITYNGEQALEPGGVIEANHDLVKETHYITERIDALRGKGRACLP